MILYHFTEPNRILSIRLYGIIKGDVPVTITGGFNAPWFTSDPSPQNQAWSGGSYKTSVRLTVDFPDGDSNLIKWTDFITKELESLGEQDRNARKAWYNVLDEIGGKGAG